MLLSEAQAVLKGRLGNYSSTALDAAIITEMNLAQRDLMEQGKFKPWFLLTESSTAVNTVDEERLSVPLDFITEWEEGALKWKEQTESVYIDLEKDDYDFLRARYHRADTQGSPKGYALANDNFLIVPVPTKVYDWKMRYYAHQPPNLVPGDENAWLKNAASWLIAETGIIIANNYVRDKMAAQGFLAMKTEAMARLRDHDVGRAEANRERMMGE